MIAGSTGTHTVCVCTQYQNAILLVDVINWDVTYNDLISKVVCDPTNRGCMMHRCEKCPGIEALLMAFLNEELEDIEHDGEFHYSVANDRSCNSGYFNNNLQ